MKIKIRISHNLKLYLHIAALCLCFLTLLLTGCQEHKRVNSVTKKDNAQWEKLGPGGGGSTFIPTFSYHTPDHFLIKCDMTGSYLTRDGGRSYTQINFGNGAASYAYDPKDSGTIFIGSTFLNRSTDGGKTWQKIFPKERYIKNIRYTGDHASFTIKTNDSSLYNSRYPQVGAICIDPLLRGHIYFSMGPLFFYSFDDGNTWQKNQLEDNISFLYTSASDNDKIYIFTPGSIYTFDKAAQTLKRNALPGEMSPAFSFTAGTLVNSNKIIFYALHQDPNEEVYEEFGHTQVWISKDMGTTWQLINDSIIVNKTSGIRPSYSMIACSELDAGQAYIVCNRYEEKEGDKKRFWYGALKTNNTGKSWEWVWKGGGGSGQYGVKDGKDAGNLKDAWVNKAFGGEYIRLIDVGVDPKNGNNAIVTDWYRVMKTTDGGKNWNQVYSIAQPDGSFTTNGMDVTTSYGVHFDPFDSNHIAISYTDIGYQHSFNGGKSWIRSVNGVPAEWVNTCYWVLFDPDVKGKVWSAWSGMHDFPRGKMTRNPKWKERARGGICLSEDGGKTWKPCSEGMGYDSPATCIIMDPHSPPGERTLYASIYNKGVFKSTDDGKTWSLKNKGIEENTCAFELSMAGNGNLFLIVSPTPQYKNGKSGREFYPGAVYKSVDSAETWIKLKITDGLIFPNGIGIDSHDPERIYLACWSDIDLSDLVGGAVARSTGGNEILNTPGGIFLSEDGGETWKSIFDPKQYVYDVTPDLRYPGRVYCNTFNKAAYRSNDDGKTWKKIKGYDFHWGHRVIPDINNPDKVYLTTFGSSVWHGVPETE